MTEKPQSMLYLLGLGNLNERLGNYDKAEELYRTAIKLNDRDGIACQQPRLVDRRSRAAGGARPST